MRHQSSVFHTVFKRVPWHVFDRLVDSHGNDARARRLSPKTSSSPGWCGGVHVGRVSLGHHR
jgi:hypothetical protein